MCELESQIHKLREELIQVNAQRKQQLMETSLRWEEEKQRAARDHEMVVNKLKVEGEKMLLDMKKVHDAETQKALDKVRITQGCFLWLSKREVITLKVR